MRNKYSIHGDIAIIEVPYKKDIIYVTIDKEDIELASSIRGKWISYIKGENKKTGKKYSYFYSNKDKLYLHKLILQCEKNDIVYFKDDDYTNIRKNNLTINTYEADDKFVETCKNTFKNMSEDAKEKFYRGMRENRYTKDWSDKLSSNKKGEKNPSALLTAKIVADIRYQYANSQGTQQSIADEYNVARTTIADILNYRTWNEVGENPDKKYRIYNENKIIVLDLRNTPITTFLFKNEDLPQEEITLEVRSPNNTEFIFVQKVGKIKLYVEIRDKLKVFVSSFEVVFPEYVTKQHIHNYVIAKKKPLRLMNRHDIHAYMQIISTYIYGESYPDNQTLT